MSDLVDQIARELWPRRRAREEALRSLYPAIDPRFSIELVVGPDGSHRYVYHERRAILRPIGEQGEKP